MTSCKLRIWCHFDITGTGLKKASSTLTTPLQYPWKGSAAVRSSFTILQKQTRSFTCFYRKHNLQFPLPLCLHRAAQLSLSRPPYQPFRPHRPPNKLSSSVLSPRAPPLCTASPRTPTIHPVSSRSCTAPSLNQWTGRQSCTRLATKR